MYLLIQYLSAVDGDRSVLPLERGAFYEFGYNIEGTA